MAKRDRISTCAVIRTIVKRLMDIGWMMKHNGKHPRVRSLDGKVTLTVPSSPSDRRTTLNWISQLRNTTGFPPQVLEGL